MHRLIALLLILAVTGCGFQPLYAPQSQTKRESALPSIGVQAAASDPARRRLAQLFQARLEDLLQPEGLKGMAEYQLTAVIGIQETPAAISPDGTISRYNAFLSAQLEMRRSSDNALVYKSQPQRISSYDNVSTAYYISGEDALKRVMDELAEDVRMRLAAFFTQSPHPQPLKIRNAEDTTPPGAFESEQPNLFPNVLGLPPAAEPYR